MLRCRPLATLVAVCLLLLLLSRPSAAEPYSATVADPKWSLDEVKKQIYSGIDASYHCFKLLTVDGIHGCDSQQPQPNSASRLTDRLAFSALSTTLTIHSASSIALTCSSL